MATAWTCKNPEEAWGLVAHFIGNSLLVLNTNSKPEEGESEDKRDRREATFSRCRAQLIGHLFVIASRMGKGGFGHDKKKILQILETVLDQDEAVYDVGMIRDKHLELSPSARKMKEELARLRELHRPTE